MTGSALIGVDFLPVYGVRCKLGKLHKTTAGEWLAFNLPDGQPVNIGNDSDHFRAVILQRASILAARKTFLDPILERNYFVGARVVHRENAGHADHGRRICGSAAAQVAIATTQFISYK
jgi:hypothetical protein